jgi:pyruvate-formate lyase
MNCWPGAPVRFPEPPKLILNFIPYLKKDLDQGRISLEFAQALLERMFVRFNERINVLGTEAAEARAGLRANDNITIGGLCVQYLVANAEELKAAKKYPDRYPDLLVRVGGYSALFTRLSPELQDAIIERVEQAL